MPSTSNAAQTSAILSSTSSPRSTSATSFWAPWIRSVSARSDSAYFRDEGRRVGVEGHPSAYHLDAGGRVTWRGDLDGQTEPVEQLRTQLALLGVHRPDEHEAGGVLDRDAVALDGRPAHRGGVEEQVDEVVVEEVDLVDVKDAAVGTGEQAGLVLRLALRQRPLEVQRAEDAVLGGTDRQLDEPDRPRLGRGVGGERPVRRERRPRAGRWRTGRRRPRRSAAARRPARARSWTSRCPSRRAPARRRPRARWWSGPGPGPCRRSRRRR